MTPTIIIEFDDSERGRDAVALAGNLGDITGARFVTVSTYARDRYGMLPTVGGSYSAIHQEARAAADVADKLLSDAPGAVSLARGGCRVIRPGVTRDG